MAYKTIEYTGKEIIWNLPLTGTSSKIRIKDAKRNRIATKQKKITQDMVIECQIGYDCLLKGRNSNEQDKIDKKLQTINDEFLSHRFIAENDKQKVIYEISEILVYAHQFDGFVDKFNELYNRVKNIKQTFEDSLITQTTITEQQNVSLNNVVYNKKLICYPCLIFKCDDDVSIEIITKDRQFAHGVQPMLYAILRVPKNICNRTLFTNQVYPYKITNLNIDTFIEIMFQLASLTPGHKRDVIKIMDVIKKITNKY